MPGIADKPATEADVVVIGCGAGGAACAWEMSRQGVAVTVLEAGPWYDPLTDYRLHRDDWERSLFPQPQHRELKYTFGKMQKLDSRRDELRSWNHLHGNTNRSNRRMSGKYHHVRAVGGSTLHFTGEAHRMNPRSMRMRSEHGVAADWPLSYNELEPYYLEAEKLVGVAGANNEASRPRSAPYPLPPHEPSYASRRLIAGLEEKGLGWTPNSLAVLSRPYDGRPACNYCGNCNRGCPRLDKGSADITFARKALETGKCNILTETTVVRIEAGSNDRVESVEFIDSTGQRRRIRTRAIVVAAGAIATPRLLLVSAGAAAPDGLSNESGLVGQNLMETIAWISSGLHEQDIASYRGLPSDIICWDYNAPDAIPGVIGGCRISPATAEANLVGPINYAKRVVGGWGLDHKRNMRRQFGRVLSLGALGESLPHPGTYVDVDPGTTDEHGLPAARINSHLDDMALQRLQFMARTVRELLQAAGVATIFEEYGSYDFFSSTHVFGTCRMGDNERTSVVDKHCASHRWRNLFVGDASVFPSSGGGESPSLTIEALAIRLGRHIRDALARRDI